MSDSIIGFIGCGNMGGALAVACARTLGKETVWIANSTPESTQKRAAECGVRASSASEIAQNARMIFLGVKPYLIPSVMDTIYADLDARRDRVVLVSMAAGVSTWHIRRTMSGKKIPVIRIMPNTPCLVGEGMIPYTLAGDTNAEDEALLHRALEGAGCLDRLSESLLDAAGSLSGCGPAFAALFLEALSDAGVECGLDRKRALLYAEQTLLGTAKLALETGIHPALLKDQVCSPGGTTIAGIHALENSGLRGAVMNAVKASADKTEELTKSLVK